MKTTEFKMNPAEVLLRGQKITPIKGEGGEVVAYKAKANCQERRNYRRKVESKKV